MGWTDKMKEWGGGDISFLSEDGECITFVVVGEPYLIKGKFRGLETQRIGCPVVTADGFTMLVVGKRVGRRLSKYEKEFDKVAFSLIRHGEPDDVKCKYELLKETDQALVKPLMAIKAKGVTPEEIAEAVESAQEVANG